MVDDGTRVSEVSEAGGVGSPIYVELSCTGGQSSAGKPVMRSVHLMLQGGEFHGHTQGCRASWTEIVK